METFNYFLINKSMTCQFFKKTPVNEINEFSTRKFTTENLQIKIRLDHSVWAEPDDKCKQQTDRKPDQVFTVVFILLEVNGPCHLHER